MFLIQSGRVSVENGGIKRTDPIYQNLRKKQSSPGQDSAKTELEDINDIAKIDMAIRISHYVDNEVESELNEVVIPLKEISDTDALIEHETVEDPKPKCTPGEKVEEISFMPEKNVEELIIVIEENAE